ncbi:MAG: hypothetical protein COV71_01510 [Candidatus Omnitrophica bacterium CG11_big_fil_rev_8_21_14_0_20_41_12]|nr:MAG: hypothetical protein COV71_01510 [Candidatus Omnitrophica bacterium CG11_big_fil_rev_8_21_14_0_20_41_12]
MSQFVWIGGSGCLLPFLIIFNLIFGRLIFASARLWLGIEAGLILLFIINIYIMARKISKQFNQQGHNPASDSQIRSPQGEVIDVQGQVVDEEKKLE